MIQHSSDSGLSREILGEIAARISEQEYLTWFQRVRFAPAGPDRVALFVPNRFYLTYLRHRFLAVIGDAVQSATRLQAPRIEFHIDPTAEPQREDRSDANDSPRVSASTARRQQQLPLNPAYSFASFVIGPSNRLAHAAAVAVARDPGTAYNPLFVHGSVGLGKTHLMQAVAQALTSSGLRNVVYVSCATFVNEFIAAVGANEVDGFRRCYRSADALLIDDVQFLADKDRTQEEFFHTFNEIYNSNRQIYLSSDSPPTEIAGLGDRLVSRFRLGLVAELQAPEFETRVAILLQKARELELELPQEVAEFVAHRSCENVREIEGAVHRIHSMVRIERRPLTVESVRHSLADLLGAGSERIDLPRIQREVLKHFDVPLRALLSKKRSRSIVVPRQICMYLARRHTPLSLGEIGEHFGGRDHSTVLHSVDKIDRALRVDPDLRSRIEAIEAQLH